MGTAQINPLHLCWYLNSELIRSIHKIYTFFARQKAHISRAFLLFNRAPGFLKIQLIEPLFPFPELR